MISKKEEKKIRELMGNISEYQHAYEEWYYEIETKDGGTFQTIPGRYENGWRGGILSKSVSIGDILDGHTIKFHNIKRIICKFREECDEFGDIRENKGWNKVEEWVVYENGKIVTPPTV
jgi:hypothetical protein